MSTVEFALPDLGEGLTDAEIVRWLVHEGDTVTLNQPLCEVETAKATVEIPSPYAGRVTELLRTEGETVPVKKPILRIDTDAGAGAPSSPNGDVAEAGKAAAQPVTNAVLVGSGPKEAAPRRRRLTGASGHEPAASAPVTLPPTKPLAKPPVRKLAKDLRVELHDITPTGDGGVITREDVELAAGRSAPPQAEAPPIRVHPLTAEDERITITGVRRAMADAMVASAFTAPHVTCFLDVDMSASIALLERLKASRDYQDVRLSPLFLAAKACITTLRRHRWLNATWDSERDELIVRGSVNLGIAAATPHGLLVPVIESADRLPGPELARALANLAADAKAGDIHAGRTKGGTFSITNIGVFGVDAGTPIIPPGQVAILALGQITQRPWVVGETVEPRPVVTLALAFDHRVVDGEAGSLFLRDVGAFLEDPARVLMTWGM